MVRPFSGGLLSAHLLASDPKLIDFPEYKGELLELARDLGNRLLPAFQTPTGIPYGTVRKFLENSKKNN